MKRGKRYSREGDGESLKEVKEFEWIPPPHREFLRAGLGILTQTASRGIRFPDSRPLTCLRNLRSNLGKI